MSTPRVLILRAPGTNCDLETEFAFERAGGQCTRLHIQRLLENPRLIAEYQILCFPGGFSYGDDISAGRILGNQVQHHLAGPLDDFKAAGKLVLGICNGFQILVKTGLLLPLDPVTGAAATLTNNDSGRFEDRWVHLAVQGDKCVFLRGIEHMYLPVAHGEGKFVARNEATLAALEHNGQLALRYVAMSGKGEPRYPDNPNGAQRHVAGVCDETGRVFGLMPHPERHIDRTQHPRWTRGEGAPEGDGLALFRNAVGYFG